MTTPLTGGRLTPGVVRVGDTVRRPASPFTATLLRHLETVGFTGAPRYLGRDDQDRDILTYVDGWVPARFQRWTNDQIAAAARLLRTFHNATRATHLAGTHEVICHHDPGPNNFVFVNNLPAALIDFDLAKPGNILEDVAYLAWTWCISSKRTDPEPQATQVKLLSDTYALTTTQRQSLIDAILTRQLQNATFWTKANVAITQAQRSDRITWSHHEHTFVTTHRATFERALT
ncbi:phosphotransferase family protein [Kribbella sp. NPDC050124]|uniref:phosphotransferase family protein n=1 Tax=Kribbella sp. NPDC050124 TaxID=3364114 RepID=UPI00378BF04F